VGHGGSGEVVGLGKAAAAAVQRLGRVVGRLCPDNGADKRTHAVSFFFQFMQNWLKLVKSKWVPYLTPKIRHFCMTLYWNL
jgi:hypothetical protein